MAQNSVQRTAKSRRSSFMKELRTNKAMLVMLAPAVIWFLIFSYIPMSGIILAFKQFNYRLGIFGSPWNGFTNFRFFFIGGAAWRITRNTILYNLAFIVYGNIMQLLVAISLSEMSRMFYKKLTQSIIFLPYFISWVLVGGFVFAIFNRDYGMYSNFVASLGFQRPDIYGSPNIWPLLIVMIQCWKSVGYGSVIYLAAITSIDPSLNEAALIDGANIFQVVRHITLPCLAPTIITLVLLRIGSIFRGDFQMFYQLTGNNGLLYSTTDVIDTYVMRSMLTNSDYGMAAAAGTYQSVFGFITVMIFNGITKKVERDYALF